MPVALYCFLSLFLKSGVYTAAGNCQYKEMTKVKIGEVSIAMSSEISACYVINSEADHASRVTWHDKTVKIETKINCPRALFDFDKCVSSDNNYRLECLVKGDL